MPRVVKKVVVVATASDMSEGQSPFIISHPSDDADITPIHGQVNTENW